MAAENMKTQCFTAINLDGFVATENDSLDRLFTLGNLNDSSYLEFISAVGALVMGSATYEPACLDILQSQASTHRMAELRNEVITT